MNILRKTTVLACLALFVAASGCTDLDVTNNNAPDRDRALATAGDVESLVAGAFHTWWVSNEAHNGSMFFISAASFQHSGWPANFGTVAYSGFPRGEIVNTTADQFYSNFAFVWNQNYSALAAIRDGLQAVDNNEDLADELDVTRLRAYGKFVQGLAHASIALHYDQGFIIDETQEGGETPEAVGYQQVMSAAMGYLDEAISIADGATFQEPIPVEWMSRDVDAATLVDLAHAYKARYMASVARTPTERANVDWAAVESEVDAAGSEFSFAIDLQGYYNHGLFTNDAIGYWSFAAWQQLNYFILGMADQSGNYQRWLNQGPPSSRIPNPGGDPVLIVTPDERFPQGSDLATQITTPGAYYAVPDADNSPCFSSAFAIDGNSWAHPERGTWRWSYYFDIGLPGCNYGNYLAEGDWDIVTSAEMRLLKAEADLRQGNDLDAAAAVNMSRQAHGLDDAALDGDDGSVPDGNPNDACVPKLPDGTCGDLMEMLKWEKRLETRYHGLHNNSWYFDGRGWGDTYSGTYLHFPIPEQDLEILGMASYTTGNPGADVSVYQWPAE